MLQKLPLFSIQFLFFNANLVKNIINKNKMAIAFINDYTVWVTGLDIKFNTKTFVDKSYSQTWCLGKEQKYNF